ncbi:MAG TPA: hypothetical protein PKW28_11975 [Turneriella sp.]|nr:hypothetical protein [Turneriella sp.]
MPHADGQLIGKYRSLLLPAEQLAPEASLLQHDLQSLAQQHQEGRISDALYATLFVLLFAFRRALGPEWLQHHRYTYWAHVVQGVSGGVIPAETEIALKLRKLPLRGMPGFVFVTLADWLERRIDLHLARSPVSPEQMLAVQAAGSRFVTVALSDALAGKLIDNKRDAFEFCLHDIGHAYTFFRVEHDPAGQLRFFAQLQNDLAQLDGLSSADAKFAADLEYCMSDMNSHPEHLRQYLRGVIVEAFYRLRKNDTQGQYSEEELSRFLAGLGAVV